MFSQKNLHLGISANFPGAGCSRRNTCPKATMIQHSSVMRVDMTFPDLTHVYDSSPKGLNQKRFACPEHMYEKPEHTGANIMMDFGCKDNKATSADLKGCLRKEGNQFEAPCKLCIPTDHKKRTKTGSTPQRLPK